MDEGGRRSPVVPNNNYAAAWTVFQACCEASVLADLNNAPLVAQLAGAAALAAAETLGISDREMQRIQRSIAAVLGSSRNGAPRVVLSGGGLARVTANDNPPGATVPGSPRLGRYAALPGRPMRQRPVKAKADPSTETGR